MYVSVIYGNGIFVQILDQTAVSSLENVSWNDAVQMGEQVSKQATHGLLLLSH